MTDPPFAKHCAEMAYVPKSPPVFTGDIQHDFRDHMLAKRVDTLSDWVGEASHVYLRAADILRCRQTDALAVSLDSDDQFDARTLWVAHDHMAAHWRNGQMREVMKRDGLMWGPGKLFSMVNSYAELLALFRQWLCSQVTAWADRKPDLLELFLLAVVGEHTRTGQSVEAELFFALVRLYPVPGIRAPEPLVVAASRNPFPPPAR